MQWVDELTLSSPQVHTQVRTMPSLQLGGEKTLLCGCAAASGNGNITQLEAIKDSAKYQQILDTNLLQSVKKPKVKRGWLLQRDKDPKQTSKSTMDYFEKHKRKALASPHLTVPCPECHWKSVCIGLEHMVPARKTSHELRWWLKILKSGIKGS